MNALDTRELHITSDVAIRTVRNLVSDFQKNVPEYKIRLRFSRFRSVGEGTAYHLPTAKLSEKTVFDEGFHERIPIVIGLGGMPADVPDAMFVRLLFTTQHELRHVEQALVYSNSNTPLDQLMSLQRLAVHNNHYLYDKNHVRLMSERDANLSACESTIKYMREEFPDIDKATLDEIIVQGIQLCRDHGQFVVVNNPDMATPEKMVATWERMMADWSTASVEIPFDYDKCDDELARLFKSKNTGWRGIEYEIRHVKSGYDSYLKLATIQCFLHPYMREHYPNTYGIDMTPKHVFEHGLPESQDMALRHLSVFHLEPYEIFGRIPVVRNVLPRPKAVLGQESPSGRIEYPESRVPLARDTSDLDRAVQDITPQAPAPDDEYTGRL